MALFKLSFGEEAGVPPPDGLPLTGGHRTPRRIALGARSAALHEDQLSHRACLVDEGDRTHVVE
jgi:hypothetical protein